MALDFRVVDVKFTKGQDTKTQAKLLMPGKWASLTNMSLSDEYTPKTREGHGRLGTSTLGGANGLATFGDELLVVSGPLAQSYSPTAGAALSTLPGRIGNIGINKTEVFTDTNRNGGPDVAYGDGFACYVWVQAVTNFVFATIVDETSGTRVLSDRQISTVTSQSPRVSFADNAFFITYVDTAGGNFNCRVVATSAPSTLGADTTLLTNVQSSNTDTCPFCTGTTVLAAVARTAGAGIMSASAMRIQRAGTNPTLVGGTATTIALTATSPRANMNGFACASTASASGVFFINSGGGTPGTWGITFDATFAVLSGGTVLIDATTPPVNGESHVAAMAFGVQFLVFTDQQSSYNTADFRPLRRTQVTSALVVSGGPSTIISSSCFRVNGAEASGPQGPFIAGKPFDSNNRQYLPVMILENYFLLTSGTNTNNPNAQCSWFLLDVSVGSTATMVAHALYGGLGLIDNLGAGPPTVFTPCSTPGIGADTFLSAQMERRVLQTAQRINITPVGVCSLRLTRLDSAGPIRAQIGGNTVMSGGQLTAYDGAQVCELGFPLYPEGISVVVTASGLGSVTVGTHQLVATYEWTDAFGQRHQSAPSPAISFTFANATDQADVIVPSLLLSQKPGVLIALWMTEASGTVFHRVVNSFSTAMSNTTAASTVAFTGAASIGRGITAPDASIRTGEILYSEPTVATDTLPNIIPGPASVFALHQNRMFTNVTDQPQAFRYSQAQQSNTGLMFNPSLGGTVPIDGGDIVGFASLDEKLIIFCERRIFVMYGTGPRPDGSFASYSEPQDIQADVGCSDARSILGELPGGVLFKSPKGWQMLGRDLSVRYVGQGAAAYDSSAVLAAVLLEDQQQARFLTDNDPDSSATLVYSYLVDEWSVFQVDNYVPTDAVWWPADNGGAGGYVTVSSTGGLNHDLSGVTNHDSIAGTDALFIIAGETAWFHLDSMEAFQRIRRMYLTASCVLAPVSTMSISFFFDDAAITSYALSLSTSTLAVPPNVDLRHKLAIQKCKSMRFLFNETANATDQARITGIQAIALEIGMKRGVNKLPAAQTVG